jgi:hypothetical protein
MDTIWTNNDEDHPLVAVHSVQAHPPSGHFMATISLRLDKDSEPEIVDYGIDLNAKDDKAPVHIKLQEIFENALQPYVNPYSPPPKTPNDVKAHTSARIRAVIGDDVSQRNMTAFATKLVRMEASGTISDTDKAYLNLIDAGQTWVMQTLAVGRDLRKDGEVTPDFEDEKHWPAPPVGLAELIKAM